MTIQKCCICGSKVETIFELPYRYTDSLFNDVYVQKIGICKKCGFIFTQNPFTSEQLEYRYKQFSKYGFNDNKRIFNVSDDYQKRCKRQKFFIEENINDKIKSIIDIGASSGYNLSLYSGIERMGIEPSKINCDLAKENYDVDMFNGMFLEFLEEKKKKKYDLVFLSHVLEHVVDPFKFISDCSKINNKFIFIEVPLFDLKFINEPFGFFCEEHVNYFTYESLINLMSNVGYSLINSQIQIENKSTLPAGFPSICLLFEKSNVGKVSYFMFSSLEILKRYLKINSKELIKVQKRIESIPCGERLVVWGTGHHVSMLLENTELKNKNIVKFYDSDIRKKDLTIMGKVICPFNEADIIDKKIDAILIGTYTAQDVIYEILKKYENDIKIYKLY